jgi:hypothetical protein
MNRIVTLVLLAAGTVGSGSALAAGAAATFTSDEIALIRDYFLVQGGIDARHGNKNSHKGLPPGIARNLARGKPLPPGIARKQLPDDLSRRLPPVQSGYERAVIDGKVVLIETASQVISDILYDIATN